jgi:hypothetical protein
MPVEKGPEPTAEAHASGELTAAQHYLAACADTRKAWHCTTLLSRARIDQIERIRHVLTQPDPALIAQTLCDLSGPMHPGDPQRAQAPMTRNGAALACSVLHAILMSCMDGRGPERKTDSDHQCTRMLDIELVKQRLACWIDHGVLEITADAAEDLDARHPQPSQIALFLRSQNPSAGDDEHAHAMLRLACVALTAPALESALVMSCLSTGLLNALASQASARDGQQSTLDLTRSAMARDHEDEDAVHGALCKLDAARGEASGAGGLA